MKQKFEIKVGGLEQIGKFLEDQKNVSSTPLSRFIIYNFEELKKQKLEDDKKLKELLKFTEAPEYKKYEQEYSEIFKNVKSREDLMRNQEKNSKKVQKLDEKYPEEAKNRNKAEMIYQQFTMQTRIISLHLLNERKCKNLTPVQYGMLKPFIYGNILKVLFRKYFRVIKL